MTRDDVFGVETPPLYGVEVELTLVRKGKVLSPQEGLELLRAYAAAHEVPTRGMGELPWGELPGGAGFSIEPGGQFEFATSPRPSPREAADEVLSLIQGLREVATPREIEIHGLAVAPPSGAGFLMYRPGVTTEQEIRDICSLQLAMGAPSEEVWREMATLLVATTPLAWASSFCGAVDPDGVSVRFTSWQRLHQHNHLPPFEGIPAAILAWEDPAEGYLRMDEAYRVDSGDGDLLSYATVRFKRFFELRFPDMPPVGEIGRLVDDLSWLYATPEGRRASWAFVAHAAHVLLGEGAGADPGEAGRALARAFAEDPIRLLRDCRAAGLDLRALCPRPWLRAELPSPWELRPVTEAHRDQLEALFAACHDYAALEVEGTGLAPLTPTSSVADLFGGAPPGRESSHKRVLALARAGEDALAGVLELVEAYPDEQTWFLGLLLLRPDVRGLGLGEGTIRGVFDSLKRAGCQRLRLAVLPNNPRGNQFWAKMGLTELRRAMTLNPPIREVILMERAL